MTHRRQVIRGWIEDNGWTRGAELGVLKGETFLYLLEHCPDLRLYGVDTWKPMPGMVFSDGGKTYAKHDFDAYWKAVAGGAQKFGARARPIRVTTEEGAHWVPDGELDFVFIDADHNTQAVAADIVLWAPKLKPDGWITGHDTHFPTVKKAINAMLPGWKGSYDHTWSIPLKETFLCRQS